MILSTEPQYSDHQAAGCSLAEIPEMLPQANSCSDRYTYRIVGPILRRSGVEENLLLFGRPSNFSSQHRFRYAAT